LPDACRKPPEAKESCPDAKKSIRKKILKAESFEKVYDLRIMGRLKEGVTGGDSAVTPV
jgi:hypothetical protein